MGRLLKPTVTVAVFFIAFAVWFTSSRYQSLSFYGWVAGSGIQTGLAIATIGLFVAVISVGIFRGFRRKAPPWSNCLVALGAIVGSELLWRLWISRGPADFKLIGAVLDVATPLVTALGIAAFVSELRRLPVSSVTEEGLLPR